MAARHRNVDSGYAWVVLLISWMLSVVSGMLYYSTGVVNSAVLDQMQEGVVKTSWVASTLLGALAFSGLVTSSLTNLWGCRVSTVLGGVLIFIGMVGASFAKTVNVLIVTYGVTVGIGVAFIDTGSVVMAGHYFEKYRPLAAGIQSSGSGWGMLIGAPLARYLLDEYGLSGMFLVLGAVASHSCACGLLLRPSPYERHGRIKETQPPVEDSTNSMQYAVVQEPSQTLAQLQELDVGRELLQKDTPVNSLNKSEKGCLHAMKYIMHEIGGVLTNVSFMVYMLSFTVWGFGEAAFHVHLPIYVESKGTTPQQSASVFMSMGLASMGGRILVGFAGSDPAIGTLILHIGLLGLAGVCIVLFALFSGSYIEHLLFVGVFAMYTGGCTALFSPNSVDLVGPKHLASAFGVKNVICGLGVLLGPPFAGFIRNYTGSYDISYYCSGAALVVASLVALPVPIFKKAKVLTQHPVLDYEMNIDPDT